jgi:hypothetical protein
MANTKTFMSITSLKCQNHIVPFPFDEKIVDPPQNMTNIA